MPERVMFGRTGEVGETGLVRLSWVEFATAFLSFVPVTGLELSTGQILGFGEGFMGFSADARLRVLHLDFLDVAVGGGWVASYNPEHVRDDGSFFWQPRIPVGEVAATWKSSDFKVNVCTRYLAVQDEVEDGEVRVAGVDDLLVHAGVIWLEGEVVSSFAEFTLAIPMEEAESLDKTWALGGGARWLLGPWSLEVGGWLPGLVWFGASVAFDAY